MADKGGLRRVVVVRGRVPGRTELLLVLLVGNGDLGSSRLVLMMSGDDGKGLALDERGRDDEEEGAVPAVPLRLTPISDGYSSCCSDGNGPVRLPNA